MKLPLDHVGVLGPSLDDLVRAWRAMGFRVSEPARLATGESAAVQHSAHVILGHTYIELTAVTGDDPSHHLARWRNAPPGARLLLLRADDADREAARLRAAGLEAGPVHAASRRLTYGDGGEVRFRWFGVDRAGIPGTLTACVQHLDADRVFDPEAATHPNTALDLHALVVRPGTPHPALAETSHGDGIDCRAQAPERQDAPWIAELEFSVRDARAARRSVESGGVAHRDIAGGVAVAAQAAGGVAIRLVEAP